MFAVFGLISVTARIASFHPETSSSFRAYPPSELPPTHPELFRDVSARDTMKAYATPTDPRVSLQGDRDAKPAPLWKAFRAHAALPTASAGVEPHGVVAR